MSEETKEAVLVVRQPVEVKNQLALYLREHYHVLSPYLRTNVTSIAPGAVPVFRETILDTRRDSKGDFIGGEVYDPKEKAGHVALTKIAIEKLAKQAGIIVTSTRRIDDGIDPLIAEYEVGGKIQDLDGSWHFDKSVYRADFRDGSPQIAGHSAPRVGKERRHINALAATKAKLRMMRSLLGLLSSYHIDELKKPFVTLKLAPDMEDKVNQMIGRAQLMGMEELMFPKGSGAGFAGDPADTIPDELTALLNDEGVYDATPGTSAPPPDNNPPPNTQPDNERPNKIKKIKDFYYMKTKDGSRDPAKPPLEDLTDAQLEEIIIQFEKLPNVREPRQESLI
jgi:hypothetical protein